MKTAILGLLILFSISAGASDINCTNNSYYWEEDSLSLNLAKMEASYFDNDTETSLQCKKADPEVDPGVIFCQGGSPAAGHIIVRIKASGETTVVYSPEQWIDFQCPL